LDLQTLFEWFSKSHSNSSPGLAFSGIFPAAQAKFKSTILDVEFDSMHKSFYYHAGDKLFFNSASPSNHLFGVFMGKPFFWINK